jgi:hypothetical protein
MKCYFFLLVYALPAFSEELLYRGNPMPDFGPGYLTFYLDNDLFANTDKDYTNGSRLSWISENRDLHQIGFIQRGLQPLTGDGESLGLFRAITGFDDLEAVRYNFGVSLTQLIFTPEDFASVTQPEGQRCYAGWSALGFSLHAKDDQILNSIELIIGVTGKPSLAEEAQNFIHDARGVNKFQGWENQIPTEITGDLSFLQRRRLDFGGNTNPLSMDGIGEWGARLGTFRTNAMLGGMLRIGLFLPADFSDPRLSETAYAHKYFTGNEIEKSNWSLFLLGGFRGSMVVHDATLDGPLFAEFDTGNKREPFVGEVYAGFGFRIKGTELSYAHTWRSREYQEQDGGTGFGTISVRLAF